LHETGFYAGTQCFVSLRNIAVSVIAKSITVLVIPKHFYIKLLSSDKHCFLSSCPPFASTNEKDKGTLFFFSDVVFSKCSILLDALTYSQLFVACSSSHLPLQDPKCWISFWQTLNQSTLMLYS